MRSSTIVAAGLAAVVSADANTVTHWEDATVTYCAPSATNCVASNGWGNAPVAASSTSVWSDVPVAAASSTGWSNGWENNNPSPAAESTWKTWNGQGPMPSQLEIIEIIEVEEELKTESWKYWNGQPVTIVEDDSWKTWNGEAPKPEPTQWINVPEAAASWINWNGKGAKPSQWENVEAAASVATTWAGWASDEPAATSVEEIWTSWAVKASATASCPSYTATAAPEWFADLPSDVLSEIESEWMTGPPSDWCYYSYSTVPAATSTWVTANVPAAASTWATAMVPAAASASTWAGANVQASSSAWAPVATFHGAANTNAGSMAMAGLAGLAAIILA